MIYLHKLLPLLLSPLVLVSCLVVYGTIRYNRTLVLTGIACLYLLSTPLVAGQLFRYAERHQVRQNPGALPPAEAIVVLSGMLTSVPSSEGVVTEWGDPDRFFGGVALYQAGKSGKLVFTGGLLPWNKQRTPEGVILKQYAAALGVPGNAISVTAAAQNTAQEAAAVKKLLNRDKATILLVTSAFHMPRAQLLFEREDFTVIPYPVDFKVGATSMTPMDFLPDAGALWLTDVAIREQLGLLYYRIKRNQ